jgi:selenocysteine-specific elongation factor
MTLKVKKKTPQIVRAMVGTAGHVSHGKSTLVEILTGCSMNRLPEEQARGLTIDLNFAPLQLPAAGSRGRPGRRVIGIIDVPGHRDFLRNMVAGASSIDILMLVVAADDGVMPQTVEHVKVARLLGAERVMVVITKTDLVEAEMLDLVREDVAGFMARSGFADVPTVCFSSKTLEGLDDVRETLGKLIDDLMESVGERASPGGAFRVNIERVFSVKGHGTVVTGTPVSGAISAGDEVELLPSGRRTTVRAIQTYKYDSDAAGEGACSAINLRDVPVEAVSRGMTVAEPGVFRATTAILGTVANATEKITLKRISELRFHSGTANVNASVRLIGSDGLRPGEQAFAEMRLSEPLALAAGDRYILRGYSPQTTVGGGRVLSASVGKIRRGSEALARRLELAREAARAGDRLGSALLAGPSPILKTEELLRLTQSTGEAGRKVLAEREAGGEIADLGGHGWLVRARLAKLAATMKRALASYHEENEYALGMQAAHACRVVGLDEKSFGGLARELAQTDPEITVKHGRLALASFKPALSAPQTKLLEEIIGRVRDAGVKGVARGNLMSDVGASEADMKLLTRLLSEDGTVKVLGRHLMHVPAFEECRRRLLELFDKDPSVELSAFREATGVARNQAVVILEQFDSEGLTRRVGNARVLANR